MSSLEPFADIIHRAPVKVSASEFRRTVAACLQRAQKEGVGTIVLRHRRVVAQLMPVQDPQKLALRQLALMVPSISVTPELQQP